MTQRTAVVVGDGARCVATELGDPHSAATVEVTDENSVRELFDQAGALITELPAEDFRSVVDVNGGAHMKRYPDLMSHVMKLAAQ